MTWRIDQLDGLRMRVRSRTPRVSVLEVHRRNTKPGRRPSTLCDLNDIERNPTWDPDTLDELASRIHGMLPRSNEPEPFQHLDLGAADHFWKSLVEIDDAGIRVPLVNPNREVAVLTGAATTYFGSMVAAVGAPTLLITGARLVEGLQLHAGGTAALSGTLSTSALPAVGAVVACLSGTLITLVGLLGIWRSTRQHFLRIGLRGIRYDDVGISYDEILDVRARGGSLVFHLLDGSELRTPAGLLDSFVATALCTEVAQRLPSADERAAGFVAYERAKQALQLD